jgi:hypothetical protein
MLHVCQFACPARERHGPGSTSPLMYTPTPFLPCRKSVYDNLNTIRHVNRITAKRLSGRARPTLHNASSTTALGARWNLWSCKFSYPCYIYCNLSMRVRVRNKNGSSASLGPAEHSPDISHKHKTLYGFYTCFCSDDKLHRISIHVPLSTLCALGRYVPTATCSRDRPSAVKHVIISFHLYRFLSKYNSEYSLHVLHEVTLR